MNLYVIVEGERTEKTVYEKWIKFVNPRLQKVTDLSKIDENNYILYAGSGYPCYFDIICAGIEDVNNYDNIDRLVIAVDSEEMSYQEKYQEISEFLVDKPCRAQIQIIIQHFCIETWALGNRSIISRNPQNERLRRFVQHFDIAHNDPELLSPPPYENLNRAQFAFKYLKTAVNEKYRNLSYSKTDPKILLPRQYFDKIKRRFEETQHIQSFGSFLTAFTP